MEGQGRHRKGDLGRKDGMMETKEQQRDKVLHKEWR